MKPTARWMSTVSSDTDGRVRRLLDASGHKGELSKFVEDAVKARLLELCMQSLPQQSRPSANDVQVPEIEEASDERHHGGR